MQPVYPIAPGTLGFACVRIKILGEKNPILEMLSDHKAVENMESNKEKFQMKIVFSSQERQKEYPSRLLVGDQEFLIKVEKDENKTCFLKMHNNGTPQFYEVGPITNKIQVEKNSGKRIRDYPPPEPNPEKESKRILLMNPKSHAVLTKKQEQDQEQQSKQKELEQKDQQQKQLEEQKQKESEQQEQKEIEQKKKQREQEKQKRQKEQEQKEQEHREQQLKKELEKQKKKEQQQLEQQKKKEQKKAEAEKNKETQKKTSLKKKSDQTLGTSDGSKKKSTTPQGTLEDNLTDLKIILEMKEEEFRKNLPTFDKIYWTKYRKLFHTIISRREKFKKFQSEYTISPTNELEEQIKMEFKELEEDIKSYNNLHKLFQGIKGRQSESGKGSHP